MSVAQDTINHVAFLRKMKEAGGTATAALAKTTGEAPAVDAGLFDYDPWEAGKAYGVNDMFLYDGKPGFVRQAHTSQETWLPFTVGTESLYGARPRQSPDGTYSYVYNMKAETEMRVVSAKDGNVYVCIQPADPLLYDPADVPALFRLEEA